MKKEVYLMSNIVCERGIAWLFARFFSIRPKRVGSPWRGWSLCSGNQQSFCNAHFRSGGN